MNTVTRDIKDYLHLYLGCPIWDFYNKKEGILFGINRSGINNVKVLHGEDVFNLRYSSVKIILRPLSDMTVEEGSEWASLKDRCWDNYNLPMQGLGELTLWLLSKHFDLFNLIESGLAISTTKQNNLK